MKQQFDLRRDAMGWTVFDRWTGETVVLRHLRQEGLGWGDATNIVRGLRTRGESGDRSILQ